MNAPTLLDIHGILKKLPHRYPFLLVDRVISLEAGKTIRTLKNVTVNEPFFVGHFPNRPVMPGVLMIEAMAQTGGWLVLAMQQFARMAFLAQVREAKLRAFVQPGDHLIAEGRLVHDGSGYAVMAGRLESRDKVVAEAEITYRVVPFPTDALRSRMLDAARRAGVPEEFLNVA